MSDLAFNLNGEPFEVPSAAVGWRVRKLKAKSAPEVVYGRQGTPLVLPIDADMSDVRREVRGDGRYRLDPVDDQGRAIPDCSPGYVCIHPGEPPSESDAVARPAPALAPADNALIEAMRINAELARAVIDKFPMMLESAAVLLRAADNAGMLQRPPPVIERRRPEPDDQDEDDDEVTGAPPAAPTSSGLQGIIETVVKLAAPAIIDAILSRKIEIPGVLGTLVGCGRASTADRVAAASAVNAPTAVAATDRAATSASPLSAAGAYESAAAAVDSSAAEGLALDDAEWAHFASVREALTPREGMLVHALAAELSPSELRTWITEMQACSVPAAVARIRVVLGPDAANEPLTEPPLHAGDSPDAAREERASGARANAVERSPVAARGQPADTGTGPPDTPLDRTIRAPRFDRTRS
jgi:hypothetical protein